MPDTPHTPEHYRDQARRLREMATSATMEDIQHQLLEVAESYEQLARAMEKRSR